MDKTTFILSTDYEEYLDDLAKEEVADLFLAILRYEKTGEVPEKGSVSAAVMIAFKSIKRDLDYNRDKYSSKCKTNFENGKKGGRPRKDNAETEKTERFPEKPNGFLKNPEKPYLSSGSEYDNDNEYDTTTAVAAVVVDNAAAAAAKDEGEVIRAYSAKEQEEIRTVYEDVIGKWTKQAGKVLFGYGLEVERIAYAITEAAEADVKKLSYIKAVLRRMQDGSNGQRGSPSTALDPIALTEMRRRMDYEDNS